MTRKRGEVGHASGRSLRLVVPPACGRGSLPAGRHEDGSDPHEGCGGVVHPAVHRVPHPPPLADPRQRQKGGALPSFPSPLARIGTDALGRKTRTTTAKSGRVVWYTPPLCARTISLDPGLDPGPVQTTGHHQIATSGVVSRTVDQIEKRSIAPRAVVVVGVPSGRCRSSRSRSAAALNPPNARSN